MKLSQLKIINFILLLILIFILAIILWGVNKGFDITDEGFTMLLYKYPQEYTFNVTNFHILGSKLFAWLNPDIITYRFLRLILSIFSSLIFSWGFWLWLQKNNFIQNDSPVNFISITTFFIIGHLSYYSLSHQIASYNPANSHLMLISSGILLFVFSQDKYFNLKQLLLVVVGIIIAVQFFVKFSSAISFFILSIILIILHFRKISIITYPIIGIIIGGLIYFIFFQDYQSWLSGSVEGFSLASSTDTYGPTQLLGKYFIYFINIGKHLILEFLVFFIGIFFLVHSAYRNNQLFGIRYLFIGITTLFYLLFLYQSYSQGLHKGGGYHTVYWEKSTHIYIIVLIAGVIASLAIFWDKIRYSVLKENLNTIGIIILLIAVPFMGMVGTNNVSSSAFKPYLVTWFALIVIFLLYINKYIKTNLISNITLITVALFVLSQIIDGFIYSHYRLADIRANQTETVKDIKNLEGIKVDIKTKHFFEKLNQIITTKTNFKEGDPIVAAYDMPGLVYALGGISPGNPWYLGEKKSFQKSNCEALSRTKLTNLNRTLLFIQWKTYKEFHTCMIQHFKKWGISSFKKVGQLKNPYTNQMVQIFIPF